MLQEIAVLRGHEEDRVWHVSWSPKGTHLASCGEDKVIYIWASSTGNWEDQDSIQVVATLEDAQNRTIRCCEWSPTGKHIACASFDGSVVVWEAQNTNKTRWDQVAGLEGHENEVKSVAWSRSGQWLATCGRDKKVWVWERLNSKSGVEFECVSMLEGHSQDVKFVQWHPRQDNVLFSCSYDDTIKIWRCDEDDDEFICIQTLDTHTATVWGLTIYDSTPHDNDIDDPTIPYYEPPSRMLSCGADLCLKLWEQDIPHTHTSTDRSMGTWREKTTLEKIHKFPIYSVSWNNDMTLQCNAAVCVNKNDRQTEVDVPSVKEGERVGGLIATGGGDNAIQISEVRRVSPATATATATATAASASASASPSSGDTLVLYHLQSIPEAHHGDVNCVRWGPRIDSPPKHPHSSEQFHIGTNREIDTSKEYDIKSSSDTNVFSMKGGGGTCHDDAFQAASVPLPVHVPLPTSYLLASAGDDSTVRLWKFVN